MLYDSINEPYLSHVDVNTYLSWSTIYENNFTCLGDTVLHVSLPNSIILVNNTT